MTLMRYYAGIDSGSWTTKAVIIDADGGVLGTAVKRSGADLAVAARQAYDAALARADVPAGDIVAVWSTGFGRHNVEFANGSRTELDCHGRGVAHYVRGPVTVVDIGGQDAKVIRLDAGGQRVAHRMNRKCAAGTGSFLDEIALRLGVETGALDGLAAESAETLELSSFCTVFAGTELLTLIRSGKRPADLAMAAYRSLVKRVQAMEVFHGAMVATGGVVAHHPRVVSLLREATGGEVVVPPHPQEMGAFGASLAARDGAVAVGDALDAHGNGDGREASAATGVGSRQDVG
ncbi:MAG: 2-hydroxyisocaproyl-CoA dehydratase activator [Gemmatimonadaceae bacterium]|nr:2-hydroxyisocaproyl-CoA dehydratase activator [Gemmatimonadaceae bacterium]